jgi:hypothetical protein
MADLTALESKIGEVLGLAMAAQGATEKTARVRHPFQGLFTRAAQVAPCAGI